VKEAPRLIVTSSLKELISDAGLRLAGETAEGIHQWMADRVNEAIGRCKANGRATVRLEDF